MSVIVAWLLALTLNQAGCNSTYRFNIMNICGELFQKPFSCLKVMEQTPIARVKRMNRRQLKQKQFIYMRPNSHDWNTVWPSC